MKCEKCNRDPGIGIQMLGQACLECLRDENDRLHARVRELEEERRWRKWPEETPEEDKEYWVLRKDPLVDSGKLYPQVMEGWEIKVHDRINVFFRPIGPMPQEAK